MKLTTRKVTRQLLDAIEEGMLSRDEVIRACLDYMSESAVADMCESEGLLDLNTDNEENEEGFLFDEL
jgi:hypothetical protein